LTVSLIPYAPVIIFVSHIAIVSVDGVRVIMLDLPRGRESRRGLGSAHPSGTAGTIMSNVIEAAFERLESMEPQVQGVA
jgi:hypothetical protein